MNINEILTLINAGYSKEEIEQMDVKDVTPDVSKKDDSNESNEIISMKKSELLDLLNSNNTKNATSKEETSKEEKTKDEKAASFLTKDDVLKMIQENNANVATSNVPVKKSTQEKLNAHFMSMIGVGQKE